MTTHARIWMLAGLLGVAAMAQGLVMAHMAAGPENAYSSIRQSIANFPNRLDVNPPGAPRVTWSFATLTADAEIRKHLQFEPIDVLFRHGRSRELNADCELYIVHTAQGEDRKHHPEICIRDVQQVSEDASGRSVIHLGDDPQRPVQRFAFVNSPTRTTTVYYWHYTFRPEIQPGQTWLQTLNQTFSRNPPSVTVQVTTATPRERWPAIEKSLLTSIDRHLRDDFLPSAITMGCDRLPIGFVEQ